MTSVAAVGSSPIAARRPGWRLVLLGGAAILAPAVQMVEWLRGRPIEVPVVAAGEALTQDLQGADAVLEGVEKGLGEETRVLRHLMSALRPPVLDNRGFAEALSEHVQRFEQENGIAVDIGLGLDSRLPPELETILYRITQESLTNVAKHAKAGHVSVTVDELGEGIVRLRVRDDGIGFDASNGTQLLREGHFGLAGMRERASLVGGTR